MIFPKNNFTTYTFIIYVCTKPRGAAEAALRGVIFLESKEGGRDYSSTWRSFCTYTAFIIFLRLATEGFSKA